MLRTTLAIFFVASFLIAGCGSDPQPEPDRVLRIYVSAPMEGGRDGEDTAAAVEIAVENAGSMIGSATIEVVALNDAAPDGSFDPKLIRKNANRAANDESAIAYIGEFDSGGTEIAMPILNRAGMLHVSSGSTAVRLTEPGHDLGEKLRPTGVTTFGRVVPNDNVQAGALVQFMREESVTSVFLVDDGGTYGTGLRKRFAILARSNGINVIKGPRVTGSTSFGELADKVTSSDANAFFFAGSDLDLGYETFAAIHRDNVHVKLFGGDGLALSGFLTSLGSIELDTYVTAPMLPIGNYAKSGEGFFESFRERFGRDAEPMSVFGYEAGSAVFESIRLGVRGNIVTEPITNLRTSTRTAFFDTTEKASPLGSYSIDTNGDTTLTFYGAYRVENGNLVLGRTIDVPTSMLQELES